MTAAVQTDSFVSRYRPLLELGRGGMARVYLAESLASGLLRKLVVLKVLNQDLSSDPEMREAFLREAEISARLNHPNIVNVYEIYQQGNTPVMVMQHLDGLALSEITSRLKGKLPLKLHLHILCQVLDALHYFHELKNAQGESLECVHRDVSPHNVMVLHEGGIKVVDFGVAKVRAQSDNHTRTGVIKGKVAYMPSEQLLSCANVDRRADIYSVGVMLWEAVAGRRMWRGIDASARMRAILRGEVPSIREAAPGVSDALAKIIERALAHTPDGRYATAEEMQIELEQVALTEGGYSLPRELAEFMRAHFGDDRRERQHAIEKAIGDPDFSVADASWSNPSPLSGVVERSAVQATTPAPEVVFEPAPRSRKAVVGAALAATLCLTVGAVMLSSPAHPREGVAAEARVAAAPVTLRVHSDPAGAEVYLDDVKLGVTPLRETLPASAQAVKLELRAPGRAAQRQEIRLQEDLELSFALPWQGREPENDELTLSHDGAHLGEAESAPAAASNTGAQAPGQAPRPRRPLARPAPSPRAKSASDSTEAQAAPAPAAPAPKQSAPADDCDPPYRLDPGGVKVFKPHCF